MADLNRKVEVAVVDEIQMIGEGTRGWAWTRAVLGKKILYYPKRLLTIIKVF